MNFKLKYSCILLVILLIGQPVFAQKSDCEMMAKRLAKLDQKTFSFYYGDIDSLNYYSNLFSSKFIAYIHQNPSSLKCQFDSLTQNNDIGIATTANGQFRIYSWDTWLGGSMHQYKNIFQFEVNHKTYTKQFDYGAEDMGTFYKKVYPLTVNKQQYYIAISIGSESSRYYYQTLSIFSLKGKVLEDGNAKIIKTSKGLKDYLAIEYDVSNGTSKWITYDPQKKIIYIPKVEKDFTVTDKFVRYKFNGKYFEKLQSE